MELQACIRCGSQIRVPQTINQTGDPHVASYVVLKTVGIRPRVVSHARRLPFCAACCGGIIFNPCPSNGRFNEEIYHMMTDLSKQCPAIIEAAARQKLDPNMTLKLMPGSTFDETLLLPSLRNRPLLVEAS